MQISREELMDILPHRAPMRFVDEVVEVEPLRSIVAKLYLDPEWDIFKGHFPDEPVFPGVLAVEAMAQTVDCMVMTVEKYRELTPLFAEIQKARFYKRILPGQTVYLTAKVVEANEMKDMIVAKARLMLFGESHEEPQVAAKAIITIAMR